MLRKVQKRLKKNQPRLGVGLDITQVNEKKSKNNDSYVSTMGNLF